MAILFEDYDDRRPALAELACRELAGALPGAFEAIEHIGSTAVPGLAAKPVIDLMAAVASLETVVGKEATRATLGYGASRRACPTGSSTTVTVAAAGATTCTW